MATAKLHGEEAASVTRGPNGSASVPYIVQGATGESDALDAIATAASDTFDGLTLTNVRVTELINDSTFVGAAEYGQQQFDDSTPEYSFDTTGATQHITQSISTVGNYNIAGGTGPSFGGAIGVTHDAVQGADIVVPVFRWTETYKFLRSNVTEEYRNTLADLTGTVNDAEFRGRAAGEVLFMGVRGQVFDVNYDKLDFSFAATPNRTGLEIGEITGIAKNGWDYLWVRYYEKQESSALVRVPLNVYVEKVYFDGDFSGLGI